MADPNEVKLVFRITDDGTLQILDAAGQKLDAVGQKAKSAGEGGSEGFSKIAREVISLNQALELAARAYELLERPIERVVGAAAGHESAVAGLNAQLQAQGRYSGAYNQALQDQAAALQRTTVYSQNLVESAQALLLTFPHLSNDVIPRATRAAADLAAAMGIDLTSAARALGSALDNPEQGLGRLSRANVRFTADQKALLQSLVNTGQTAKAYDLILSEIDAHVGGRAAA
ncbi:MAG: hypothetical protein ACRETD_05295, partial [Steroidobacteraceae bacterium]